ncbi:MAG: TetR-like C-terminal domain-containing protein [Sphaerochaetaceae bacterium]|jgi:AcrR family transcriptional regulator|nr:TetR-like C-terminal domain-containing protein [Sphaerochaetaceae bacterium]NLY08083.1 hypothetical protein [Spirochaetales bacterium]
MGNKTIKKDLRVIKTKKAIRYAFLKLIQKKELNEISISEISAYAMIDRKTFYSHYNGIYDLVDEIENEVVSMIDILVLDIDAYSFLTDPKVILSVLKTITEQDPFIFARTLTMKGNDKLLSKFVNSIKMLVVKELKKKLDMSDQKLEIMVDYNISGMISCYQNWLRGGRQIPIESLSEQLSQIAVLGLQGISRK